MAATNMVVDIAILVLPMHMVWHLRLSRKAKLSLSGVIMLGGLWDCTLPVDRFGS